MKTKSTHTCAVCPNCSWWSGEAYSKCLYKNDAFNSPLVSLLFVVVSHQMMRANPRFALPFSFLLFVFSVQKSRKIQKIEGCAVYGQMCGLASHKEISESE